MWTHEHSAITSGTSHDVWHFYTDPDRMRTLPSVTLLHAKGRLALGSRFTLRIRRSPPLKQRVTEFDEDRHRFIAEARVPGAVIRTHHIVEDLDGESSRVTEKLELVGPASWLMARLLSEMMARTIRVITDDIAKATARSGRPDL